MSLTYKTEFEQIVEHFKEEISKLRASRATPALIEDLIIEVYGSSKMQLKELASISAPKPRSLVIKPWDKTIIKNIEKSLINSHLEFNPVVETDILRIQLPELTQETRQQLTKKLFSIAEDHKIKMRSIRDDAKKTIEAKQKSGEIPEDDKFVLIEELNKLIREQGENIDKLTKKREEDIMTL